MYRLSPLTGALLLAATTFAGAQSLPDPVAPAVIGRPLDKIRPARAANEKNAAPRLHARKQVAPVTQVVREAPAAPAATAPAVVHAQPAPAPTVVTRTVGPGAYFNGKDQALVRSYYDRHPVAGGATRWKVGEPLPQDAVLTGVPDEVRAALPVPPPGYQYVQLDDEVVVVALQTRRVFDGVARGARLPAPAPGVIDRLQQQFARYFAHD